MLFAIEQLLHTATRHGVRCSPGNTTRAQYSACAHCRVTGAAGRVPLCHVVSPVAAGHARARTCVRGVRVQYRRVKQLPSAETQRRQHYLPTEAAAPTASSAGVRETQPCCAAAAAAAHAGAPVPTFGRRFKRLLPVPEQVTMDTFKRRAYVCDYEAPPLREAAAVTVTVTVTVRLAASPPPPRGGFNARGARAAHRQGRHLHGCHNATSSNSPHAISSTGRI
jgi:hypothetical protein